MKAFVYSEYGPPSVLRLAEVEPPVLRERDVLVRVHAASINSWDERCRACAHPWTRSRASLWA
jgi:NADPH:quinone reductase-like Zn-dependent oxidoreductase